VPVPGTSAASVNGNYKTVILTGTGTLSLLSQGSILCIPNYPGQTLIIDGPALTGMAGNNAALVDVLNSTLELRSGTIGGNINNSGSGGGVYVHSLGTFTMSDSAVISGNTASGYGGGVYVDSGTFTKSGGSVIYGDFPANTTTAQTAGPNANTATNTYTTGENGHAVLYYNGTNAFYRNNTLDTGDNITTTGVSTGDTLAFEGYR
jgi:predicted outer membrane repeat protein